MNKEFLEKIKECKTDEEVKELAERENMELTDEEAKSVAGGSRPPV